MGSSPKTPELEALEKLEKEKLVDDIYGNSLKKLFDLASRRNLEIQKLNEIEEYLCVPNRTFESLKQINYVRTLGKVIENLKGLNYPNNPHFDVFRSEVCSNIQRSELLLKFIEANWMRKFSEIKSSFYKTLADSTIAVSDAQKILDDGAILIKEWENTSSNNDFLVAAQKDQESMTGELKNTREKTKSNQLAEISFWKEKSANLLKEENKATIDDLYIAVNYLSKARIILDDMGNDVDHSKTQAEFDEIENNLRQSIKDQIKENRRGQLKTVVEQLEQVLTASKQNNSAKNSIPMNEQKDIKAFLDEIFFYLSLDPDYELDPEVKTKIIERQRELYQASLLLNEVNFLLESRNEDNLKQIALEGYRKIDLARKYNPDSEKILEKYEELKGIYDQVVTELEDAKKNIVCIIDYLKKTIDGFPAFRQYLKDLDKALSQYFILVQQQSEKPTEHELEVNKARIVYKQMQKFVDTSEQLILVWQTPKMPISQFTEEDWNSISETIDDLKSDPEFPEELKKLTLQLLMNELNEVKNSGIIQYRAHLPTYFLLRNHINNLINQVVKQNDPVG